MPPALVRGTELGPAAIPVASGYPASHFFCFFVFWGSCNIHIHTHTHTRIIGKFVPLHPCVPVSPTVAGRCPRTQVRHMAPLWREASIIDHHYCIFSGDGQRVASVRVFLELPTPGKGPRGHEILHHVAGFSL
jgi:hypothetical protein